MAMAKTSSSKKVARVARSGGGKRRSRERPKLGFALSCFVIIVLGTATVVYARSQRIDTASAAEAPRAAKGEGQPGDHWHAPYGMYVCDHFLPIVTDVGQDKNGIHTHGDGVIHMHPFNAASAGSNARLKLWGEQVNVKFGDGSITWADGQVFDSNYKCGDKPAKVYIYRWPSAKDPTSTAEVFEHDFGQIRVKDNFSAFTFAVVPEGTDPSSIPKPDSVSELDNLTDLQPGDPGYNPAAGAAGAGATGGLPTELPGGTPGISIPGQPATPGAPAQSVPSGAAPSVPVSAAPSGADPAAPASPPPSAP